MLKFLRGHHLELHLHQELAASTFGKSANTQEPSVRAFGESAIAPERCAREVDAGLSKHHGIP
jgi:hypothetical protein